MKAHVSSRAAATPAIPAIPAGLAARPIDARRGVPIPYVAVHDDDNAIGQRVDFSAINAERVVECGAQRRCGLCGNGLGYWIAFLGGPKAAAHRRYVDPPMHEDCARAAIQLCPHIAVRRHARAPEHRLHPHTHTPADFDASKPDEWVLGITRTFELTVTPGGIEFHPAPFKRIHRFAYTSDNTICEQP